MDISQLDLESPGPVAETVTDELLTTPTVAVYGKAKGLERLVSSQQTRHLWISGVDAATARVIGQLSLQRLVIHDLRIAELSALACIARLQDLSIAGSPKLKSLAGVEKLTSLRRLVLFDCCNYQTVDALAALQSLETLCLEGGFSKQLVLPSLSPLSGLTDIRCLRLASLKVTDRSLRPLHRLSMLRDVFIAKAFPASEFVALAAALPNARGQWLDSFR